MDDGEKITKNVLALLHSISHAFIKTAGEISGLEDTSLTEVNYINNPLAADRLRYDVLFHTDLSRDHGNSNGLDLGRINWGNYDLVWRV